jgi:hypothetical protein
MLYLYLYYIFEIINVYDIAIIYTVLISLITYITLYYHFDNSLFSHYLLIQSILFPFLYLEKSQINLSSFLLILLSGFIDKRYSNIYLIYCWNLFCYFYLFIIFDYITGVFLLLFDIKKFTTYKEIF